MLRIQHLLCLGGNSSRYGKVVVCFLENAGWIPCQWVLPIQPSSVLRVSLEDGDVPIDNSASERAIRTFCLDKKNWMFHNTATSAMVYSISETAKLNNLRPYYYFKYILTE